MMKIRKLTFNEKKEILKITHSDYTTQINLRKNYINNIILNWLRHEVTEKEKKVVFFLHCQYGKAFLSNLIIQNSLQKNPNYKILCVYPEERLLDDFKKSTSSSKGEFIHLTILS